MEILKLIPRLVIFAFCQLTVMSAAELKDLTEKKVLFLGDSITYGGDYVVNLETYLRTRFPSRAVDFINAGLSSETVSGLSEAGHAEGKFPRPGLFERIDRVLEGVKPDLVIACYGMNCGIYQPLDEERFALYRKGIEQLRKKAQAIGAAVIHLTPPTYDQQRGKAPGYAAVLDAYSEWLIAQREKGWTVLDLHFPMKRFIEEKRSEDPEFFLQKDAVHPLEQGHWIMAKAVLEALGADLEGIETLEQFDASFPEGEKIRKLTRLRMATLRDAILQHTGHQRPGVKPGLPIDEAVQKAEQLDEKIDRLISADR